MVCCVQIPLTAHDVSYNECLNILRTICIRPAKICLQKSYKWHAACGFFPAWFYGIMFPRPAGPKGQGFLKQVRPQGGSAENVDNLLDTLYGYVTTTESVLAAAGQAPMRCQGLKAAPQARLWAAWRGFLWHRQKCCAQCAAERQERWQGQ